MYLLKQKRNLSAISFGKHSFVKNLDIKKKKKGGKKSNSQTIIHQQKVATNVV